MKVKPAIIVYGNCQAEAISAVLTNDPVASDNFEVLYVPSFRHPTRRDTLREEHFERAALLLEQHDPHPFPHHARLSNRCQTITFPATDFNLLWPFNCTNPYDQPEPDTFPYGHFPYGNRIIAQCVARGMTETAILEYYFTRWEDFAPPLDRLFDLEVARLQARDAECHVKISDYIFSEFRRQRLFWTINHPASALLRELLQRLLLRASSQEAIFETFRVDETIDFRFNPEGPLGVVSVPIHPQVISFFDLKWYDQRAPHQSYGNIRYSSEEYFRQMIRWSIRIRDSREGN